MELHRAVSQEFGGRQAFPGLVDSQFGLVNTIQRPQTTIFGKDAYPTLAEKATAMVFALLQNMPFRTGNRRTALAALIAFFDLNEKSLDSRIADEKTLENAVKRAATYRQHGLQPESVFAEMRDLLKKATN